MRFPPDQLIVPALSSAPPETCLSALPEMFSTDPGASVTSTPPIVPPVQPKVPTRVPAPPSEPPTRVTPWMLTLPSSAIDPVKLPGPVMEAPALSVVADASDSVPTGPVDRTGVVKRPARQVLVGAPADVQHCTGGDCRRAGESPVRPY